MNKQSLPYTVVFSFIVCFAFVFLLSLTHQATQELVLRNQELRQQRAVLRALTIEYDSDQDVFERFADIEQVERDGLTLFRITQDGENIYASLFSGSGLWGTINGTISVNEAVDRIVGIEIIDHNETPGLGGRIDEPEFKNQFQGKSLVDGRIQVVRDGDAEGRDGQVDAVTGATATSRSMETIINRQLERLQNALGDRA